MKIWDSCDRQGAVRPQGPCRYGQERGVQPGRPASGVGEPGQDGEDLGQRDRQGALRPQGPCRYGPSSVAFSPDGQRLASASADQTVKIWDSTTGKELFALKGHAGGVSSVAFSPDGQRLASASSDQTVKIWDSATGKELFALKGHAGFVHDVAFSPDGQRLASASNDQTVRIWDSATGKELLAFKGHAGWVQSVAFSPDGQRLASANEDGSIHLWETMSVSREIQHRRATNQMVADLFGQMPLRADVLERLRTLPGMSPSRRQEVHRCRPDVSRRFVRHSTFAPGNW